MKTKIISSILLLLSVYISGNAQQIAITTTSNEINNNLDLKAVSYLFGTSQNLEDFEGQINNPQNAISNLDLNRDGYVDYLRIVETNLQNTHTVNIQAALGNDLYQDIAMIAVQKDNYGKTYVRMIGNESLYGYNYVLNPVYVNKPVIVANFWKPNHTTYRVSYGNHYPVYYKPRIVRTAHVHNEHLNYFKTAYYNTNCPTVGYHHSVKPHYNNVKSYTSENASHHNNKYTKHSYYTYSGKQSKNAPAQANKQSNKQTPSVTAQKASKQIDTTVRYTRNTPKQVNTRSESSSVRTASVNTSRAASASRTTATERSVSNSRSDATARTTQNRSRSSVLALK